MQISLFDQGNIFKIEFQNFLKDFDLESALLCLQKWTKTLDAPDDLARKAGALKFVMQYLGSADQPVLNNLARLSLEFRDIPELQALKAEFRFLYQGINKVAAELIKADDNYDFIIPAVHPARFLVEAGNYKKARQLSELYLQKRSENTRVRQLLAYALYNEGEDKQALFYFTKAIFWEPPACERSLLAPKSFADKFDVLFSQFERAETAWLHLPFALWKDGKTYINPEASRFENELREQVEKDRKKAVSDPVLNIMQFNHLLYLAEAARLRNGKNNDLKEIIDLRGQMQLLNKELFINYMSVLQSFGNT